MRKFYLENAAGDRINLSRRYGDGYVLSNPSGLGITLAPSFANLGSGFFTAVDELEEPQGTIVGDIVIFGHEPYAMYRRLIDWIAASDQLYLCYVPAGDNEYRRRVKLDYLNKTEKNTPMSLVCPVCFFAETPWYVNVPTVLPVQPEAENVLRCDYDASLLDDAIFPASSAGGMSAEVVPRGHIAAAMRLVYDGAIINPVVTVTGLNTGTEYGRCSLSLALAAQEGFVLDTRYIDPGIYKRGADGLLIDVLDGVDLAFDPFPRVPCTEPCAIRVSSESTIAGTATANIYYYYRSV